MFLDHFKYRDMAFISISHMRLIYVSKTWNDLAAHINVMQQNTYVDFYVKFGKELFSERITIKNLRYSDIEYFVPKNFEKDTNIDAIISEKLKEITKNAVIYIFEE